MQFDGTFLWTDDAGAIPPAPVESGHRRRGYVGGVARILFFAAALVPLVSCR